MLLKVADFRAKVADFFIKVADISFKSADFPIKIGGISSRNQAAINKKRKAFR